MGWSALEGEPVGRLMVTLCWRDLDDAVEMEDRGGRSDAVGGLQG